MTDTTPREADQEAAPRSAPRNPPLVALWVLVSIAALVFIVSLTITGRAGSAISSGEGGPDGPSPDAFLPALITMLVSLGFTGLFTAAALVLHGIRWYLRHPPRS